MEISRHNQFPVTLNRMITEMAYKEIKNIIGGTEKDLSHQTRVFGEEMMVEKTTTFIGENYIALPDLAEFEKISFKIERNRGNK